MTEISSDPRYPIGKYTPQPFSEKQLNDWINDIRYLPSSIENAILNLDASELNSPYREGGWKISQLIHHIADSHMNAYIRFKLGLTEENPAIKPYEEKKWAELSDTHNLPCNVSITLLHALHTRWVELLKGIKNEEWERTLYHPEHKKNISLWYLLGMYSWHGRHHLAHIERRVKSER